MNEELYEGYDEERVEELEGITDKVTDLSYTKLEYPAIVFKYGSKLPKHKVILISNMVKSSAGNGKKDISLYFHNDDGDLYKIGMLSGHQVEHFLSIVPKDSLIGFYDDGTRLIGDRIYVLCSFF